MELHSTYKIMVNGIIAVLAAVIAVLAAGIGVLAAIAAVLQLLPPFSCFFGCFVLNLAALIVILKV